MARDPPKAGNADGKPLLTVGDYTSGWTRLRVRSAFMGCNPQQAAFQLCTSGAFIVPNPRIHLKWNSGFDPSFGILRCFRFKACDHSDAIRRTRRDAVGAEVFLTLTSVEEHSA